MKKLLGILLSITMLFSLSACSSKIDDEAITALETALQNLANVNSAQYQADIAMHSDSVTSNASIHGAFKLDKEKPLLSAEVDMDNGEEELQKGVITLHMDGEFLYLKMMGLFKQKFPIKNLISEKTSNKIEVKLPKDKIKKYLKEANVKNNIISIKFDSEELMKEMRNNNVATKDQKGGINVNQINMKITLKNKMISKASILINMDATVDGKKQSSEINIDFTLSKVNKVNEITFPDFKDYQEGSMNDLLALQK